VAWRDRTVGNTRRWKLPGTGKVASRSPSPPTISTRLRRRTTPKTKHAALSKAKASPPDGAHKPRGGPDRTSSAGLAVLHARPGQNSPDASPGHSGAPFADGVGAPPKTLAAAVR